MWATLPGDAVRLLPGLALTAAVAWLGLASAVWIGEGLLGFDNSPISGIMMAILAGLALGNLARLPDWVRPGVRFSLKRLLRLGIILLGIRLSLGDVLRLGALGVPLILLCIAGASLITAWLGRRLRLSARLSTLIGVGTSVCGATAIVAAGPAIDAREEELTYAIANITVFGILAMLLYPLLGHALFPNDPTSAGLFLGTSIHETAQVAGGGLIYAELYDAGQALDVATVTKLVRNVLMALVIPLMAYVYQRRTQAARDAESRRKLRFLQRPVDSFAAAAAQASLRLWLACTQEGRREELAGHPWLDAHLPELFDSPEPCSPAICHGRDECHVQRARRLAREADLVVVNHSLLMNDFAAGRTLIGPYALLVVDEAHRLPQAALEVSAIRIDAGRVAVLEELIGEVSPGGGPPEFLRHLADRLAGEEIGRAHV